MKNQLEASQWPNLASVLDDADRTRLIMNKNAMAEAERRQQEWNTRHAEAIDHATRHNFTAEPWATMYANHWQGSIQDFEKAVRE